MRWFVSFFSDVLQVLTFTDPRLASPCRKPVKVHSRER